MELKHVFVRIAEVDRGAFNRTTMELKHWLPTETETDGIPFNRTTMELKQIGLEACSRGARVAFNRTTMELKHPNRLYFGHNFFAF